MPRAKMAVNAPQYQDGQNVNFFLEKFEKVAQINQWTEEEKCVQFCLVMPKSAEQWYLNLTEGVKRNFDDLKESFKNRFDNVSNRANLYAKFMNLSQENNSVQQYIENVTSRGRLLNKTENEIMDRIIYGMKADIKKHVIMKEPKTMGELVKFAKMAEDVQEVYDARIPLNQTPESNGPTGQDSTGNLSGQQTYRQQQPWRHNPYRRQGFTQKQKNKCIHCGRCNHLSSDCYFRNATCHICKKIGHTARVHQLASK
ncbi:uncharacterized protein LOC128547671 [Mercenaria mercenaria]|uniref:uncharacterized protein LOC128547671 n=1 Tax=Mercenaria mercenaria TaxID=6596 RepID=UPI00234F83CF|nr:uncharacterized protein LOC128547671 [Mercenaria mercenaria]